MKTKIFSTLRHRCGRLLYHSLLLLFLAGCASPAARPPADVNVLVPRGVEESAARAAAAAYERNTGKRVRVEALGSEFYLDRAAALLLAGLAEVDLVLLPGDSLAHWAGYHALRPFSAPGDESLQPWAGALVVENEQYGLPLQPVVEVLWYRADLLEAAGLSAPRTWADFRAAALAVNDPPKIYGAAVAGSGLDSGSELAAVLAGFGGQAVGPEYRVQLDSIPAQRALEFYAGLFKKDAAAPPGAGEMTRAAVLDALARGQAALGIAPLSAASRLRDCAASPKACDQGRPLLEWAWLPGLDENTAFGSLSAWAMPYRAAHPQAAEDFARWLCGEEGASAWAKGGGTPANRAVLAALGSEDRALARVEIFLQALPLTTQTAELWKVYHAAAHRAAAGLESPQESLEQAAVEMDQLLRQDGY